jgi:GNAT superfamily N-acetyltransferase
VNVVHLAPGETHDLRRKVLYGHWPDADVVYPQDAIDGAFHLGVMDHAGRLVGAASWYPEPSALFPGRRAYRMRGMAVDPARHGQGVGRLLFEAGLAELRTRGAELVWANARDTAVGFYRRLGMTVVGEGFLAAGDLPHHVVVLELT